MLSARAYSFHQKSKLAISLSWIGGYTNAVMVMACGMFASNMTGNSTWFGTDIAQRNVGMAMLFGFLVACFFLGAIASAVMTEGARRRGARSKYVLPMALEGTILGILAIALRQHHVEPLGTLAWHWLTGLACFAMGLQNATVTEISGAVVRTTHLTGVITDLGLEGVRFVNWYRDRTRGRRWERTGRVLRISQRHPAAQRLALLGSIFGSFVVGTIMGALAHLHLPSLAMIIPVAFLMWIILMDWRKPIADLRELDLLGDPELQLHGIMHSLLPAELGLYRLSHHRADRAHHPPDFHQWAEHLRDHWRVIILAVSPMTYFTTNSVEDLRDVVMRMHDDDRELVVAGITPKQFKVLERGGLMNVLEAENFCPDLEFAIARGIELVRQRVPSPTPAPHIGQLVTGA
jgi:uncharacterized membrane protein YoaK (UPF0700 family)